MQGGVRDESKRERRGMMEKESRGRNATHTVYLCDEDVSVDFVPNLTALIGPLG